VHAPANPNHRHFPVERHPTTGAFLRLVEGLRAFVEFSKCRKWPVSAGLPGAIKEMAVNIAITYPVGSRSNFPNKNFPQAQFTKNNQFGGKQ